MFGKLLHRILEPLKESEDETRVIEGEGPKRVLVNESLQEDE